MRRIMSVLLLIGALCSGALAAGDELSDLLDKGRRAARNGDYDEAERFHRLAVDLASSVADPAIQAEALGDLGGVLLAKGRFNEGKDYCLKSLTLLRNTKTKRYLPVVLNNLGGLANQTGEYELAEKYLKEAIRVAREFAPADPYLARVLNNLGVLYYTTGDVRHAEKALKEAIVIIEATAGQNDLDLVPLLANLGEIYVPRKKWDAAKAQFDRALSILAISGNENHRDGASVL